MVPSAALSKTGGIMAAKAAMKKVSAMTKKFFFKTSFPLK